MMYDCSLQSVTKTDRQKQNEKKGDKNKTEPHKTQN